MLRLSDRNRLVKLLEKALENQPDKMLCRRLPRMQELRANMKADLALEEFPVKVQQLPIRRKIAEMLREALTDLMKEQETLS